MVIKQTPLVVEMDYPGIKLAVASETDYGERRVSCKKEPETITETAQIMAYLTAHGLTYRSRHRASSGADDRYSKVYNYVFERSDKPASP